MQGCTVKGHHEAELRPVRLVSVLHVGSIEICYRSQHGWIFRATLAITAALSATACFSSSTVIRLRGDRTGTIQVTSTIRKAALAHLETFAHGIGPRKLRPEDSFPEHDARSAASSLGTNVRFVSTRVVDNDELLGRVTIYEFSDIGRVTLEPIPVLPAERSFSADARLHGEHRFTFDLIDERDNGSVLIARMPDARIEYSGVELFGAQAQPSSPEDVNLLRRLVTGGLLEMTIEPEQQIVRSNTPHVDGQRITLVRAAGEPLLLDDGLERQLLLRPGSLDELRVRLHDARGVTVAPDSEIRIELAPQPSARAVP